MRKIAILQSNYIPWKGYFDLMNKVDDFIFYDEVQYTKNDWRNRNKIKSPIGTQWLTIPVHHETLRQKISDIKVANSQWRKKHWLTIKQQYSKAKYFKNYSELFENLYNNSTEQCLSEINYQFIFEISKILGIETKLHWTHEFSLIEGKNERLVGLCNELSATSYVSGPAAKAYLDEKLFNKSGITVEWMDYDGYPEYSQLHPPFAHGVTILDLIFNEGPNATNYMKSFIR